MHKRSILSISDWTFPVLVTCSSDVDTVSGVCALRGSVSTVPPWVWDGDCILPTPKCFQPRFRTKTSTTHPPWKYSSSREVCIWNRWFIRRPSVPCRKGVDFSAFWKTSRFTRDEVGCASWNNCDRCEIRVCFFPSFFFISFLFFFFFVQKKEVGRSLIYTEAEYKLCIGEQERSSDGICWIVYSRLDYLKNWRMEFDIGIF